MKRTATFLALLIALPSLLFAQQSTHYAEWFFVKQNHKRATGADFITEGRYRSTQGAEAWISLERAVKQTQPYLSKDSEPTCNQTHKDDYWLFAIVC